MNYIFCFLVLPLLVQGQSGFWDKHYLTYSLENDFQHLQTIKNSIREMEINTLEIEHVDRGKGDIKIYFTDILPNHIIGSALMPNGGKIRLNRKLLNIHNLYNISKIVQHEFAHALGLSHSNDYRSGMFPEYTDNGFTRTDKDNLNELYKCRYDSVTLLNDKIYVKFKGRNYEKMNLSDESITRDKLWYPHIFKVNAMFKSNNYFVIHSNFKYLAFNQSMHLIKEGYVREIFPSIDATISAVLTLKNGSIICFDENRDLWYDGVKIDPDIFEILPNQMIQGAFATFNRIYLIAKDYIYTYDEDFQFITTNRLCDDPRFEKVHCCNGYSNM